MKKKYFASAALLYVVLFTIISAMGLLYTLRQLDKRALAFDKGFYYIFLQHKSNPLDLPDNSETMRAFSDLQTALSAPNDAYQYFEIYKQPLINVSLPNGVYAETGELTKDAANVVQSVQVSQAVQGEFNISLLEGELLSDAAFVYHEGDSIPVVLGYEYSNLYHIGEIFTAEYLFHTFSFQIKGFLDLNSQIALSSGSVRLDQAILMPSFAFASAPQTEQAYVTQKIHAANRVSGKLKVSPENYAQAVEQLQSLTQSSPLGEFSVYSSSSYKNYERAGIPLNLCFVLFPIAIAALFAGSHLLLRKERRASTGHIRPLHFALVFALLLGISLLLSYGAFFAIITTLGMQRINFWSIYCGIAIFILEITFVAKLHTGKKSGTEMAD